jgi:hypothetical protein
MLSEKRSDFIEVYDAAKPKRLGGRKLSQLTSPLKYLY